MKFTYEEMAKASISHNEVHDCIVKAVSIAFGMTYEEAHHECKIRGRKRGSGLSWEGIKDLLEHMTSEYGFDVRLVLNEAIEEKFMTGRVKYSIKAASLPVTETDKPIHWVHNRYIGNSKTIRTFARNNPKGTYIVFTHAHATAIVDGVVQDWARPGRGDLKRIFGVVEIK